MEFDQATRSPYPEKTDRWDTHYEILVREFEQAGYEIPELVFWNLAGGRTGLAAKPVEHDTPGTALVSGYSAAMVKLFMSGEDLQAEAEADEEEEDGWDKVSSEGEAEEAGKEAEPAKKKRKMDPVTVMKKAIAHESFAGIKVYD